MKATRSHNALVLVFILSLMQLVSAAQWEEFIIYDSSYDQQFPDVDGQIIVWQQEVEIDGTIDSDLYGADLDAGSIFAIA